MLGGHGGLVAQWLTVPSLRQGYRYAIKGRSLCRTSIAGSTSASVESVGYLLSMGAILGSGLVARFRYSHCLEREAGYWVRDAGMRAGAQVCSNAELCSCKTKVSMSVCLLGRLDDYVYRLVIGTKGTRSTRLGSRTLKPCIDLSPLIWTMLDFVVKW